MASKRDYLRKVTLIDGYRLRMWDSNRCDGRHGTYIGYELIGPQGVVFSGEDISLAPGTAYDSNAAVEQVLFWLTLKPGDTSDEHFEGYNDAQMAWCDSATCRILGEIVACSDEGKRSIAHACRAQRAWSRKLAKQGVAALWARIVATRIGPNSVRARMADGCFGCSRRRPWPDA